MYSPIIINKKLEEGRKFLFRKSFASVLAWSWVIPPNNKECDLVALSDIRYLRFSGIPKLFILSLG